MFKNQISKVALVVNGMFFDMPIVGLLLQALAPEGLSCLPPGESIGGKARRAVAQRSLNLRASFARSFIIHSQGELSLEKAHRGSGRPKGIFPKETFT
jgi:hypothetical protein